MENSDYKKILDAMEDGTLGDFVKDSPTFLEDSYQEFLSVIDKMKKEYYEFKKKNNNTKKMEKEYIQSPLNYMGGKYKLLPQILPLFPKDINTFVDLFCGGCNVGINANAKKIIFNDNLSYLIDMYKMFLSMEKEDILKHIKTTIDSCSSPKGMTEEGFKTLTTLYNEDRHPLDLFILSCFSFNNYIRFNSLHQFNASFGKRTQTYSDKTEKKLCTFLDALKEKNVEFFCLNFTDFDFSICKEGYFVYADPPYLITTATYNNGTRGFTGWNEDYENKLLETLNELSKKGVKFGLSNVLKNKGKENKLLSEWIEENGYQVKHLNKSYNNSSYNIKDRKPNSTDEVFVCNYELPKEQNLFS